MDIEVSQMADPLLGVLSEETIAEHFRIFARYEKQNFKPLVGHPFLMTDAAYHLQGDLYLIYSQLRVEILVFSKVSDVEARLADWSDDTEFQHQLQKSNFWRRLAQLFTVSINRRAALAGCVVMASQ
jgi:hypothetical protein